ncbi:MAG: hypothetical protein H6509_07980 [Bryobacterales bacterium]|nr:hypothetical protein [Bryobacterales bacterium]
MFSARDHHCELRVAVQRSGDDGFALYYELRNLARQRLFVLDGVMPAEAPYYIEREGDFVVLSQKLFPIPRGLLVERPEVPLAALVEPGQRLRHKLELKLPLRESIPYPHLLPKHGRSQGYLVMDAAFEIGYFADVPPEKEQALGEGFVLPGYSVKQQTLLRTGPIGRVAFDPVRR